MENLQYIEVSKIHPHPGNPRKDLGDLSELAESIKVNGFLQNLTVVPLVDLDDPDASVGNEQYTVIIGHRRLAAAALAGLDKVPCVIADMNEREQARTMLMENMQRTDLTVYEQAQGFQMMLDLGESVEEIAQQSGFSMSTVRRRVKLLDLDHGKFMAASKRGGTIMDYAELEKIEDPALKNKVLDTIGTDNFRFELKQAMDEEKKKKKIASIISKLSEFATQITDKEYKSGHWTHVEYYAEWNNEEPETPENAGSTEYFFHITDYGVSLYTKAPEEDVTAAAEKERRRQEQRIAYEARSNAMRKASRRAYDLRREFAYRVSAATAKKHMADIVAALAVNMSESHIWWNKESVLLSLGVLADEDLKKTVDLSKYDVTTEFALASVQDDTPGKILWRLFYETSDSSSENFCYEQAWKCCIDHKENEVLTRLYALLEKMGYGISDEERQLMNGSHELFGTDEEEE